MPDIATILSIIAVIISLGVWWRGSVQWNLLNRERLVLVETNFTPVRRVHIPHNERPDLSQGIPGERFYHAAVPEGGTQVEVYGLFSFQNSKTGERIEPEGFFTTLNDAIQQREKLAIKLKVTSTSIEIRHNRRVSSKFRNTGNLPMRSVRSWCTWYIYGDQWYHIPDDIAKLGSFRRDSLNAGEEMTVGTIVGGFDTKIRFPEKVMLKWTTEFVASNGKPARTELFTLFETEPTGGVWQWRSMSDSERESILGKAKEISYANVANRAVLQRLPP